MTAFDYLQYVVLEQLDALAVDGVSRVMSGFSNLESEADRYADLMFDSYMEAVGSGDPADFAEEARDQAVQHYVLLSELRQSLLNLLAVALYHLFEQHRKQVVRLIRQRGGTPPPFNGFDAWGKVDELRLVANTVKHAEGSAARQLRAKRPDLFVEPILRDSPLGKHTLGRPRENPLGGTDLFVSEDDLTAYRDAIGEVWEDVRRLG